MVSAAFKYVPPISIDNLRYYEIHVTSTYISMQYMVHLPQLLAFCPSWEGVNLHVGD